MAGGALPNASKEAVRFHIWSRHQLGENSRSIHNDLIAVMGYKAPSYNTVCYGIRQFQEGRQSFEDEPRSGRPATSVTEPNVAACKALVEANSHVTVTRDR